MAEHDIQGNSWRQEGIQIDISLHKEKEISLMEKNEKMYSQQMNRLINFSNIVSHNLKTHVGNIKMLLDITDIKEDQDNAELIRTLRIVSNDLNDTISDLTQIVRIQNNTNIIVKPVDVNFYLKKVIDLVNGYNYNARAEIINNVAEGSIVNFNPAYLESILLNFSTNAIKYAHPDRRPKITFDFFIKNGVKTLTVTDNGVGIDLTKYGDVLFGLYKTFHKNEKARGLGLYMVKNQIETMKGKISVKSKVGEGTVFKIKFND
jgi:signal transduction histidine kinase